MKINEMTFEAEVNATKRVRRAIYLVRKLESLLKDIDSSIQTTKSFANNIDITDKDLNLELLSEYVGHVEDAMTDLVRAETVRWGWDAMHEGSDK